MRVNYKYTTILLAFLLVSVMILDRREALQYEKMYTDYIASNSSIEGAIADTLAGMRGKTGDDLEQAFLVEMIKGRQGALDMANLLISNKSIRPELSRYAREVIFSQTREINMMQAWQSGWYGN